MNRTEGRLYQGVDVRTKGRIGARKNAPPYVIALLRPLLEQQNERDQKNVNNE